MKNIILIISILFSFNAIGAETKYSKTGLEGWGRKGVQVVVVDYTKKYKNFPLKAIETKVELRLRQAGIKVIDLDDPFIVIDAVPSKIGDKVVGYNVTIEALRYMEFKALDNKGNLVTYRTWANSEDYGGSCPASGLIKFIDGPMDQLLLDHAKVNPKKK